MQRIYLFTYIIYILFFIFKRLGAGIDVNNDIKYIVKYRDVGIKEVLNTKVLDLWPQMAKNIWEKRIQFETSRLPTLNESGEMRTDEAVGKPVKVIGCTDINGLQYLCEWQNGATKLLPAALTNAGIALKFIEGLVIVDAEVPNQLDHSDCSNIKCIYIFRLFYNLFIINFNFLFLQ